MIFRTDLKARRTLEEYLECRECTWQMFSDTHEVCHRCKSDNLKWMTQYTVYQTVFTETKDEAIEIAYQKDKWQISYGKIVIEKETPSITPVI